MGGLCGQPLLSAASLPTSRAAAAEAGGPDSPRERERQVGMECQWGKWGSFGALEYELGVLSG